MRLSVQKGPNRYIISGVPVEKIQQNYMRKSIQVLKPSSSTLRLYSPRSTVAKKKPPVASVAIMREKRVGVVAVALYHKVGAEPAPAGPSRIADPRRRA